MKTSKKILSLILTVALVSSINWGYFTQLLNLTKSAAIELVTGGSVAGAALVAELNDLSISKFFEFNIDDFLVDLFDEIIHDDSEDNTTTENVKTSHGVSLDVNPETVSKFGGAYRIEMILEGLNIIQRRARAEHFEIVPAYEMPLEQFQNLLNQITFTGPY